MNTAVILAAGMGIRLSPIVGIRPKGLLKIGDYPLLGRSINMLKKHGINKIFIVTGHQSEMLMSCLLYTSPSPRDGLLSRMPSSA